MRPDPARRRARRGLRIAAVVTPAIAGGLVATTVFACTGIMGPLTMNPTSGPPGVVVSTTASGLKPYPARYDLFFGGTCMTFTGKLLKTITTNLQGGWNNVKVTIPKKATMGSHSLCGVEAYPNAGATATDHGSFTVV